MVECLTTDRLGGPWRVFCAALSTLPLPPNSNSGPAAHELSLFPSMILKMNFSSLLGLLAKMK